LCAHGENAIPLQIHVKREWSASQTGKEQNPEVERSQVTPNADVRKSNNDREERVYLHEVDLSLLKTSRYTFGSKIGRKPPQLCHVVDHGNLTRMLGGEKEPLPFSRVMARGP